MQEDPDEAALQQIMRALDGADPDKLREIVRGHRELAEIKKNLGPQTKEEFWEFFKENYKIELGTVAVCPGHVSQLDLVWEVYTFEPIIMWVLSRGFGKTSLMALVDDCTARHYPGFNSFTIGPGRDQGERKYEHLLPYVIDGGVIGGKELPHVERSIQTKTQYRNGSVIEISLGGDPANANGPRSVRLHRDETELMQAATRKQAANIPAGKKTRDGRYVPAQTVDTSTMKYAGGYIDQQMEDYNDVLEKAGVDSTQMDPIDAYHLSIERGHRPSVAVRISCIFEVAAENPACRSVPEDQRRARLLEKGLDPDQLCSCASYTKGTWDSDDPEVAPPPRTLEEVCQGRFFRSRGHKRFSDITTLFLTNDRTEWEAEQECSQPSREGAFLKAYSQTRHGIRGYEPDPENGRIYSTTDWGGTDLYHHSWWQELDRPVVVGSFKGDSMRVLPVGTRVAFGEVSIAKIGNVEMGRLVQERELMWIIKYPGWRVDERYYDYASPEARYDWEAELGMQGMVSRIKKDFAEEVKIVRTEVGDARIMVDIVACPVLDKGMRSWRQVNGREVHDHASHPLAGVRYYLHNRRVIERALAREGHVQESLPAAADDQEDRPRERVEELERGVRIIRHRPVRSLAGVAGAEDSPLRSGSGSIGKPDLRSQRTDR